MSSDTPDGSAAGPPREAAGRAGQVPVQELVELTPLRELARAALRRAQAAAAARGLRPGTPARRSPLVDDGRRTPGRDPEVLGDAVGALLRQRGWVHDVAVGGVVGRWRETVGEQMADHCTPESFEDGVLTVRTDSTSWASAVRLLVPQLLGRLSEDVGPDVVRQVRVLGPVGPGFGRGRRSVRGRGPRDTWG